MRAWRVERVKRSVASSALPVGGRGRKHEVGTAVTETELCANARNNGRTLHARGETQPVRQRATRNIYTTALRALRHTHLTHQSHTTLKETKQKTRSKTHRKHTIDPHTRTSTHTYHNRPSNLPAQLIAAEASLSAATRPSMGMALTVVGFRSSPRSGARSSSLSIRRLTVDPRQTAARPRWGQSPARRCTIWAPCCSA